MLSPFKTKFWILAFIGCLAASPGWTQSTDDLAPYEQQIFSHSYTDEALESRVERLESSLFGEAQTGPIASRKARVLQVMGNVRSAMPTQTLDPLQNNSPDAAPNDNPEIATPQPPPKPDATDYPTVTGLERAVFSRDFIHDDINTRLGRLEKKVFGQPYPDMALVDRVDKLLARYPNASAVASTPQPQDNFSNSALNGLPSDSSQFISSSRDVYAKMDALERNMLSGATHSGQLLTERLDRLESRAYGHTFSGESIDTRVSRLLRAYRVNTASANGPTSNPYAVNPDSKGYQPRPGFQSRQDYQPPPNQNSYVDIPTAQAGPPPIRQNVQIGAGLSQNTTHHFSNELMNMLPPDVRGQMTGQSSSGTVVSSPGTVVIEQSTSYPGVYPGPGGYPGFQPYGAAGLPTYNYYGPGMQTQTETRSSTTIITPNGASTTYNNPGPPAGLPNPAYVGDPAFLQSLNLLETNVFGQVNTMEPVYVRLGKLESSLLGQVYAGYPEAQRLANLQKAYQYQSVGKVLGNGKTGELGRTAGSMILGIPLTPSGTPSATK